MLSWRNSCTTCRGQVITEIIPDAQQQEFWPFTVVDCRDFLLLGSIHMWNSWERESECSSLNQGLYPELVSSDQGAGFWSTYAIRHQRPFLQKGEWLWVAAIFRSFSNNCSYWLPWKGNEKFHPIKAFTHNTPTRVHTHQGEHMFILLWITYSEKSLLTFSNICIPQLMISTFYWFCYCRVWKYHLPKKQSLWHIFWLFVQLIHAYVLYFLKEKSQFKWGKNNWYG